MAGAFDRDVVTPAPKETPVVKTDSSSAPGSLGGARDMSGTVVGNKFDSTFVRDLAKEKEMVDSGVLTQEYIDARGGLDANYYYGDVPSYSRLSSAEYRTVTNPDGTINTAAQAALYQQKAYAFYISQGMEPSEAAYKASSGFGDYALTTFKDAQGNIVTPKNPDAERYGVGNPTEVKTFAGFDTNNEPVFTFGSSGSAMTSEQYSERTNVMDTMRAKFKDYGLEALIPTIEKLAMEGATESTISLALRESDAYKTRFAANEDRKKAGLAVLDPKTYLSVEDSYRQTLRAYGLSQFDNDNYVRQFIANDLSPTELANRVATAVERVQNADPAILRTLQDYYGIGSSDLVSYTLDPDKNFQKIQRQVAAAEIGATARMQGVQTSAGVSEALAAQGVTQEQAQKGYAAVASVLPTAEKLSDIYGNQVERYGQTEAEQETFNSLASAQRKRQKLTSLEISAFSGQSGTSRAGLSSKTSGQF